MKKWIALLVVFVMVFALGTVGAQAAEGDDWAGKTLTISLDAEPKILLAQAANVSACEGYIVRSMFNTLWEKNEEGETVPCIATDYEWVDDLHIRITIRDDVKACDGSVITAEDVVYSFQLGLEGTNATWYGQYFNPENFVVEDDVTFILELSTPYASVMDIMPDLSFQILSKHLVEELGGLEAAAQNPRCNTGRYNLEEWLPGQYVMLKYNENYWDDSYVPAYEYLKFVFIPDSAARALSVESGDSDVALQLSLADTMAYQASQNAEVHSCVLSYTTMLFLNCSGEFFSNELVREAIGYLVDFDACRMLLTGGMGAESFTVVNPSSPYYLDQSDSYSRSIDVEKAKELLAEAGYPDGFTFTMYLEPSDELGVVGELVQQNLAEAGIKVVLEPTEFATWVQVLPSGNYEAYIGTADAANIMLAMYAIDGRIGTAAARGGMQFNDPELQAYLDVIYESHDENERIEACYEAQRFWTEHSLAYGICSTVTFCLAEKGLTNFITDFNNGMMLYFIK